MADIFLIGTTVAMLVVFTIDTVRGRREINRRK